MSHVRSLFGSCCELIEDVCCFPFCFPCLCVFSFLFETNVFNAQNEEVASSNDLRYE